jgi:transcriptional regulator of NAD metabolism
LPDYPFAVIAHPIAGNTDAELKAKAEQTLDTIVRILSSRA